MLYCSIMTVWSVQYKAWVNFNGNAGVIYNSFNVGSVTKNATGNYTLNFTTAMPNTNYAALVNSGLARTG